MRCQTLFFTLLLVSATSPPAVIAGPEGGQVVGGSGSISQSGLNTTINQSTQNMSIDWQSYNVNANERVQYIQPNSSSISLNRILSQNGSTIAGRIDANGQVILVNPNGIFFTPTSVINVGGIIASGLNIQPNDFMNGNYIFDEVLGTDGTVINSGIINASLGGNVALIGKQVENDGLIVANLGSVSLAAGKQAVLTFDDGGLLGVRVSKEILQEELGVDPAVLNSGEINTEGGRVLLTASTSQDVFSQAVNTGDLNQNLSVVMHEDGSFTLGDGADVLNTGNIDTSTTENDQNAGRIVLLGENVTSGGELNANAQNGNGGDIELHAQNTALLIENSVTSVRSESNGQGGSVKILGDNVGLFDRSIVEASGGNGGGQVFIGGDQEGNNALIPNSEFIYLSEDSQIFADALDNGDGGRVITFASDSARIYGDLFARGGANGGDGGFIETSGLRGFEISSVPDTSAVSGRGGIWLIDPYSITINDNTTQNVPDSGGVFTSTGTPAEVNVDVIGDALNNGSVVIVRTGSGGSEGGNIIFDARLDYDRRENATLTLDAQGDIRFMDGSRVFDGEPENNSFQDALTLNLHARGEVIIEENVSISTQGGNFVVGDPDNNITPTGFANNGTIITGGGNFSAGTASNRVVDFNNAGTISTTGAENQDGGDISIYTSGALISTGLSTNGGTTGISDTSKINRQGREGGDVTISAASVSISGVIDASGSAGRYETDGGGNNGQDGGDGGIVNITALTDDVSVNAIITSGGEAAGDYAGSTIDTGNGGDAGAITLTAGTSSAINLNGNLTATGARGYVAGSNGSHGDGNTIDLNGDVVLVSAVEINAAGAMDTTEAVSGTFGDITFGGITGSTDRAEDLTVTGNTITFSGLVGNVTRLGNLNVSANGAVDAGTNAIVASSLTVTQSTSFTSGTLDTANTGGAGGAMSITADEITLNDDLNASGTTAGTINLTLSSAGSVTLARTANFTSSAILTGSSGMDTLNAANRENSWSLTSADSTLNNLTFSGIETLVGNAQGDTFTLPDNDTFTGTLSGGGGSDTLQAGNRSNDWAVTGNGVGSVTGLTGEFTDIETLTGGNKIDAFNITAAYNGDINGGDNNDIFNIAADVSGTIDGNAGDDTFNIQEDGLTAILVGGVPGTDIDTVIANDSSNTNTWNINTAGGGTLGNTGGVVGFSNIENLTGGTGFDRFVMGASGSIVQIDGDAGTNALVARQGVGNIWGFVTDESGTLTQAGESIPYVNTFMNIQTSVRGGTSNEWADLSNAGTNNSNIENYFDFTGIIGNGTTSILNGQDGQTNDWTVQTVTNPAGGSTDGINDGTFSNSKGTLTFINFGNLTGGNSADNFVIGENGSVTGTINGGDTSSINTLTGRDANSSWSITNINTGWLAETASLPIRYVENFTDIQQIIGGSGNDVFTLETAGRVSNVTGGAGNDRLVINASGNQAIELGNRINDINLNVFQVEDITANADTDNTLVADNDVPSNIWTVNANNAGTVSNTGSNISFTNFTNLVGSNTADNFTVNANASIGSINTGNGTNRVTVNSDGRVTGAITGGNDNDTITVAGIASGVIDGGDNTASGNDTLMINASSDRIVQLGGVASDGADYTVSNIEVINTDDSITTVSNTLRAGAGTNIWNIDTDNGGNITNNGNNIAFSNFANLDGNIGTDEFTVDAVINNINAGNGGNIITVNNDGNVTGTITGGDGIDRIMVAGSAVAISTGGDNDVITFSGTVNGLIDGGMGMDQLTIVATGNRVIELGNRNNENQNVYRIETLTANRDAENTLIGDSNAAINDWAITDARNGTVSDQSTITTFSNIDHVTGGDLTDNITLESNDFAGLINGGIGVDTVLIDVNDDQVVEIGNRANENLNIYQVENITANGDATRNELIGDIDQIAATTNWDINGMNTGRLTDGVNTVEFTNFTDISGANGNAIDRFTVSGNTNSGLSGLINGMGGNDSLIITADGNRVVELGSRSNENLNVFQVETITANSLTVNELVSDSNATRNSWIVNTDNGGTLSDNEVNNTIFSNFSTLSGGATIDEFVLNSGVSIDKLNGGDGNNIFTLAGRVTDSINGGNDTDIVTLNVGSDVERVNLGAGDDRFIISGGIVRSGVYGEDGDDTFVSDGGDVNLFDGGDGANDRVSYTGAVTITLGDVVNLGGVAIQNIEGIDAVDGTLNARQGVETVTTWTIDGVNAGQVYDATDRDQILSFRGFSVINGGAGTDNFSVTGDGSISGTVNGNGGNDTVSIDLDAARRLSGQIGFSGGDGNDAITITGVSDAYAETWSPNANGYDQLSYVNNERSIVFEVDYQETETVNNDIQTTSLIINSVGNNVELGNNSFRITRDDVVVVNYQAGSKPDIIVFAQDNSVNIASNVSIANNLTIIADMITQNTATTLVAGHLTLDNVNQAGTAGDRLRTNVGELSIINHSGSLFINEQNGVNITGISNTSGSIDITAADFISSMANLATDGALDLVATNRIDLSGDNQLAGALTLSATSINLDNATTTTLTGIAAQDLTIDSTGDILSTGEIVLQDNALPGLAKFTSTMGSITLDNENNNFDVVEFNTDNGAVILNESDGITITNTQIAGALTVTANTGLAANDNMGLGSIRATNIELNAGKGAIISQSSNLMADNISLAAASGIGVGFGAGSTGAINTETSTLSVINASFDGADTTSEIPSVNTGETSGVININNRGNVTINDLRNYGNISLTNSGNIILNVTSSSGAIDANYGGNTINANYAGDVIISGSGTSRFSTLGVGTDSGNADIIAQNLQVSNVSRFGTQPSPIGLRVNDHFTLLADQGVVYYLGSKPSVTTTADLLELAIQGFVGISSQQLIDIESLGEIDPAIFTEVRNYNYDDIAIRLPADQGYDDDDDEETEE